MKSNKINSTPDFNTFILRLSMKSLKLGTLIPPMVAICLSSSRENVDFPALNTEDDH